MDLPEWLDKEAWAEYLKMRTKIKKPMTDYAKKLALNKLVKLYNQGNDPTEVLNQSIFNSWQGLFEVKNENGNGHNRPDKPTKSEIRDQQAADAIENARRRKYGDSVVNITEARIGPPRH